MGQVAAGLFRNRGFQTCRAPAQWERGLVRPRVLRGVGRAELSATQPRQVVEGESASRVDCHAPVSTPGQPPRPLPSDIPGGASCTGARPSQVSDRIDLSSWLKYLTDLVDQEWNTATNQGFLTWKPPEPSCSSKRQTRGNAGTQSQCPLIVRRSGSNGWRKETP
jgi:hypothetical protein